MAEKAAKTVNYTPEQTAEMVEAYVKLPTMDTVEALAKNLGKTTRSIIAKLSREKVYVKPGYTTKTGEAVVKKDALADKMADAFGLTEAEADSLTKANKTALAKILAAYTDLQSEVSGMLEGTEPMAE